MTASGGGLLGRRLDDAACEALLIVAESARDPDVAHHTSPPAGPVHVGRCLLVLPRRGEPRFGYLSPMEREEAARTGLALLTPEDLEVPRARREGWREARILETAAAAALTAAGLTPSRAGRPTRVALAGRGGAGTLHEAGSRLAAAGWELVDGSDLARELRKPKGPRHMAGIRHAAAGACDAFRAVAADLAAAEERGGEGEHGAGGHGAGGELWLHGERLTVGRLRATIAGRLASRGLGQPHGNIVAPGRDAGIPHSAGADSTVLRARQALVVDLYPSTPPFADCTRTFCVGEPGEALAAAHAAVLETLTRAHRQAVPGARGWDLQMAACAHLEGLGYVSVASDPEATVGYVHGLGHGVGYELHEYPSFRKETGAEGVLAVGDVLTLEPGLYDPDGGWPDGGWGVRLEDLVWLGEGGAETLTPLPYELDPRAWVGS